MHKYLVRHLANKSKLPDKLAGSSADRQLQGWRGGCCGKGGYNNNNGRLHNAHGIYKRCAYIYLTFKIRRLNMPANISAAQTANNVDLLNALILVSQFIIL